MAYKKTPAAGGAAGPGRQSASAKSINRTIAGQDSHASTSSIGNSAPAGGDE